MDRRIFLRSILGVAAATALPSEVWPFRKIFLPAVGLPLSSMLFQYISESQEKLAEYLTGAYPGLYGGFRVAEIDTKESETILTPITVRAWHVNKGIFT